MKNHRLAMMAFILMLALAGAGMPRMASAQQQARPGDLLFRGTSDTSAAVMLDASHFAAGDDENNILRIYPFEDGSLPAAMANLGPFLQTEADHPEADIEGAVRVGDRIYWITSHGRNKDGKPRPGRCRFFATDVKTDNGRLVLTPAGQPCRTLLQDMLNAPQLKNLGLEEAAGLRGDFSGKKKKRLAPKDEGLNIEALAVGLDGQTLYLGFRNPQPALAGVPRAGALAVPLLNPAAVIEQGAPAQFGEPLIWDLGGLALRGMGYIPARKCYYLIAGPYDTRADFQLYRWSGRREDPPVFVRTLFPGRKDFTPESFLAPGDGSRLLMLSDDGSVEVSISDPTQCLPGEMTDQGKCPNKYLSDENMKTFKGAWIDLESPTGDKDGK